MYKEEEMKKFGKKLESIYASGERGEVFFKSVSDLILELGYDGEFIFSFWYNEGKYVSDIDCRIGIVYAFRYYLKKARSIKDVKRGIKTCFIGEGRSALDFIILSKEERASIKEFIEQFIDFFRKIDEGDMLKSEEEIELSRFQLPSYKKMAEEMMDYLEIEDKSERNLGKVLYASEWKDKHSFISICYSDIVDIESSVSVIRNKNRDKFIILNEDKSFDEIELEIVKGPHKGFKVGRIE